MYEVKFYRNRKGQEPVLDYINKLSSKKDKDSRNKLKKIVEYIDILAEHGTRAGEPYMKSLGNGLWELRPKRDRILFVASFDDGKTFVLLHHFVKTTQKTPAREIETARRAIQDLKERGL